MPRQAQVQHEGLLALLGETRAEPGSVDYFIHRDNDDPCLWILYENWRSRADLDAHLAQPYTRAFMARFPEILVTEIAITFATMVSTRP